MNMREIDTSKRRENETVIEKIQDFDGLGVEWGQQVFICLQFIWIVCVEVCGNHLG